jgi:hypothetical protein
MIRLRAQSLILAALCVASSAAAAETRADLCAPPKMQTDKWRTTSEAGGMSLMLPPGFAGHGVSGTSASADAHFYSNGQKTIMIGSGAGPSVLDRGASSMNQKEDCVTFINGRRVELTMYDWTVEDQGMSPSGEAGTHYGLVARFFTSSTYREVFIAITSNLKSDVMYNRPVVWTATFGGAPMTAGMTAPSPTVSTSLVAAGPGAVAPASPASPAPACNPDPRVPAADAIVDTATVQMLVAGSGPIPKGFVSFALKFSGESLAGITVAQSDLPDATQRQLATLVASNVRPHDAKTSAQYLLRIETQEQGLHYTVQPACIP